MSLIEAAAIVHLDQEFQKRNSLVRDVVESNCTIYPVGCCLECNKAVAVSGPTPPLGHSRRFAHSRRLPIYPLIPDVSRHRREPAPRAASPMGANMVVWR
jgi:hypothetical protein